jgi:hypothetical protein
MGDHCDHQTAPTLLLMGDHCDHQTAPNRGTFVGKLQLLCKRGQMEGEFETQHFCAERVFDMTLAPAGN